MAKIKAQKGWYYEGLAFGALFNSERIDDIQVARLPEEVRVGYQDFEPLNQEEFRQFLMEFDDSCTWQLNPPIICEGRDGFLYLICEVVE